MDTNTVFDRLFKAFPKARESKSLNSSRPKGSLDWKRLANDAYVATGPRGGTITLKYNERSNKITISRKKA
jgi:hypothetical protein